MNDRVCARCGQDEGSLKKCGACKEVRYCCRECQRLDWSDHKAFCQTKMMRDDQRLNEKLAEKLQETLQETPGILPGVSVAASLNDPEQFYVVAMATRNGVHDFMHEVEFTLFAPDTPKNDLFELSTLVWKGMLYLICGVPKEYGERLKVIARSQGMKVCDGVPTMMAQGEKTIFPLSGPNVWTLENREKSAQSTEQFRAMMKRVMEKKK